MYQVKVFDGKGKLKNTLPPEEVMRISWAEFKKKGGSKIARPVTSKKHAKNKLEAKERAERIKDGNC